MKESHKERRQYERATAQTIVLGILNSDELETVGSVSDISLGGVKCTYDELIMRPENTTPIRSIDLIVDSHYLYDIPCQFAWNVIVESGPRSKLTSLRQCGIQFGKLTPNQIFLLRSIINCCSSHGIRSIISNVQITKST